jgi:predicted ATPase/DNA-binding SARP family transcriptional activator
MRVGVLGPLTVTVDGAAVEVGGGRLQALLVRLALDAKRVVGVEALAAAVWPGDGPADVAHALQSLVSRLRRCLPAGLLASAPGGYRLDIPPDAVDALRFERLATEGRRAWRAGQARTTVELLQEALGLWRGEALAGLPDAPFAAAAAARLEELRLSALEDRSAAEIELGHDLARTVAELQALTATHPLRERLHTLLVKALHTAGRPAEALVAYENFRQSLADALGTDPGPELREAHLALVRGQPPARPAGTGLPPGGVGGARLRKNPAPAALPRGNLREPLTSFIGRAAEQDRIGGQLDTGRLVTLIGPGGVGKTRLATTVAARLADRFAGGVWLVELAPVTEPGNLPQVVAGALGLREVAPLEPPGAAREPLGRLVEAFSGEDTLLVLDNCEHLVDACARLAGELLGRCPPLRVLATSREPLGLGGEALCPVLPLGLPEPGASAAEALACPAVRLFADRVSAAVPGFAVDDANAPAVVEICRRLDGLPLAIELAAARLRSLSVEQLAARLDDRFHLLTGGSRTALPRHQTLRAVVDWTWDLLDADERRFAERLAVFPAAISVEAAEQVAGPVPWVLDTLAALVDKSLLQVVEGAEPRYRMLETIREYGRDRLAQHGQLAEVRAVHTRCFLHLAELAEPHVRGTGQVPWVARLAGERDNLVAALRFAADTGDADTAVRLAAALGLFWTIQGNHAEAVGWIELALGVPGPAAPEATVVAAVFLLFNSVLSGGHPRAVPAVEKLYDKLPDPPHPACALIEPMTALSGGDPRAARRAADARLSHPDPWTRAMLRLIRAFARSGEDGMAGMAEDLAVAAGEFRVAGERWGRAMSLSYLAYARSTLGAFAEAVADLEEAVTLLRTLDRDDPTVLQRVWLADARRRAGDVPRARAELLDLVGAGPGTASSWYLVLARIALGDLARHEGDLAEAARQYDAARRDLDRMPGPLPLQRAMLDCALGHLAVATGDLPAARRHVAAAFAVAVALQDPPLVAVTGVAVARLCLRESRAEAAAEVMGATHVVRGATDEFNPEVAALLADLRERLGAPDFEAAYARGRDLDRAAARALIEAQVRRR